MYADTPYDLFLSTSVCTHELSFLSSSTSIWRTSTYPSDCTLDVIFRNFFFGLIEKTHPSLCFCSSVTLVTVFFFLFCDSLFTCLSPWLDPVPPGSISYSFCISRIQPTVWPITETQNIFLNIKFNAIWHQDWSLMRWLSQFLPPLRIFFREINYDFNP